MTQAVTRYTALYESLRSRRRRAEVPKGLDRIVAAATLAARDRGITLPWLRAEAAAIDAMAPEIRSHSEGALDQVISDLRDAFIRSRHSGARDYPTLRRALAVVREVARRETGEEPFPVQLMAALAMYHGRVVQMFTGEGKTLTGSLVAPLLAWRRRHVHVFTVNDYLARRDAQSRAGLYARCLCGVGAIQQDMGERERFGVYALPIIYGTPKQITADWLRDQIRLGRQTTAWGGRQAMSLAADPGVEGAGAGPMIPGLRAALVDEADAVLIDEGVVPLIIARARRADEMGAVYLRAASIAAQLDEGPDYSIDHVRRQAELRARGRHRAEGLLRAAPEPIFRARRRAEELIRLALVARHCYRKGHQYQAVDGRVVIVDEYTGRFLPDRSWEHGLHQSVEAKEGLDVTADRETLARMSFQRFFRSYPFLCGMTGTVADAAPELRRVYARKIVEVPTHRPLIRVQMPTRFFRSAEAKWAGVVDSIGEMHRAGRPVLVGTRSIESSEQVSRRLEARGIAHRVLNANFDKEEAELIAGAGRRGAITVATNMAGRGTDIKLDDGARDAGGLHIVLTEMHTAKRIDRQFIGRAGRQGDPGSAQTFVSLEDELVRLNTPGLAAWVRRAIRDEELPWSRRLAGLFRLAQRRAEARARRNRAAVLRQDDWIEKNLPG
ncbi:MAG: translocase [Phycisphaerales bacterium]|nr:translocase [Phycisphaerales bacterium]